eukprot:NODE_44_length_28780_cov_0.148496.p10 type:complete len:255 gc:universal NODE_44_length_28780_cov_0.148496:22545-21781(-)
MLGQLKNASKIKNDPYKLFAKMQSKKASSEEIQENMKNCESTPLWNLAIETAWKEGKGAAQIWKMFNKMKKRHLVPNSQSYTHMFKILADKQAVSNNERLLKMFSQIPQPNEIHMNSFVKALCFNGCYDSFFRLYSCMKDSNLNPDKLPVLTRNTLPIVPLSDAASKFSTLTPNPLLIKSALNGLSRCPGSVWRQYKSPAIAFELLFHDIYIRAEKNEKVLDKLTKLAINDCLFQFKDVLSDTVLVKSRRIATS